MLESISNDIRKNIALAIKCGFEVPEMQIITDDLDTFVNNPYWCIDDGIALHVPSDIIFDYCLYYDGEFKDGIIFINDTHLLSGQMGATLPANLVTAIPGSINVKQLHKLKDTIEEYEKDFNGYITIRFALHKKKLYYQRISFRLISDYLYNIVNLCDYNDIDSYLLDLSDGVIRPPAGISVSCRLFSYPYDAVENIETVKFCADELNLIELDDCFIATASQMKVNIKDAWTSLYSPLNDKYIKHRGVVFNNDGGSYARMVWSELQKGKIIK
jgi:hypothetical protein